MKQWAQQAARWMAIGLPAALPFYLVRFSIGPLPTTLLEIYVLVLIGLAVFGYGRKGIKEARSIFQPWVWPVGLFLLASLAAVFWSPIPFSGFGLWRAYILEPLAVFFFLPILIRHIDDRRMMERIMALVVIGVGAWSAVQYAGWLPIPSPWDVSIDAGRRATGPFPFPNALALFVVPFGAYLFHRWMIDKKEWVYLVGTIAAFVSTVLAQSDGGMLALAAAIVFVLLHEKKFRMPVLAIILIGVIAAFTIPHTRNKIIEEATFQSWSGRVRVWMWDETRRMLADHPIAGAGMAGYPIVFAPYHEKPFIEVFQYPHNIVLNFWSETGLVGLIAFGLIVFVWIKRRNDWVSLAPLFAILIHGLVDVPYFKNDLAIAFWLLVFLTTVHLDREPVKR
ncbi:O-antigen ligase family protein [Candidatus Uhrbacteria bacterium]|nr:O-antigen ligase family protein [Candidatus Uhrbacteria bacterium]